MDIKMEKRYLSSATPIPVMRALRKLGSDIRAARLRRRIPTALIAERASISRTTLNKVIRQKNLWVSSGSGSLPSE